MFIYRGVSFEKFKAITWPYMYMAALEILGFAPDTQEENLFT